jgi:hypothetical protein
MAKIQPSELLRRINGVSTPWLGVQWTPPSDERKILRDLVTDFENRRVLILAKQDLSAYAPHAIGSIEDIRGDVQAALKRLPEDSYARQPLRRIRAECQNYRTVEENAQRGAPPQGTAVWQALGQFRATFGYQLAVLCALYGIELEREFDAILPPPDEN